MMEYLCFFILLLFILKCFSKPLIIRNLPHCSLKVEVGTQTDFTDQEAYLREIIDNNNKKIHKLEQEIDELKCQLQDTQRQSDSLSKRLFNFENCKAKDSNAAFYTGFQSWDILMAVFKYFDPGERGENISYWRSKTDNNTESAYGEDRKDLLRRGELDL